MRSPLPAVLHLARGLRRRLMPPVVTVVVPFYNVKDYLDDCVTSITKQTLRAIEVILVDDGSTDGSHEIASRLSTADRRIRVLRQANQGPGAARNAGVARARGVYLSFVDSDDRLPPDALRLLVDAARRDGADISVGAIRRFNSTRTWVPRWVKGVHSTGRRGITLQEFPALLRNNYPVGKVYRRGFWEAQKLPFREGVIYEDQPLIAQMFSRASKITVLTDIVYDYRAREDRSSVSQRPEDLSDLRDRVTAWRLSLQALQAESPAEVVQGWYETVYNTHFHWYLNSESISDPGYWAVLADAFRLLEKTEPEGLMERLSPEKRVAVELLRAGRQEDLVAFRAAGGYDLDAAATTMTRDGLRHHLPVPPELLATLPPGTLVSRPDQLELRQEVTGGRWLESPEGLRLELTGVAQIAFLDPHEPVHVDVFATNRRTGRVVSADISGTGQATDRTSSYRAEFRTDDFRRGDEGRDWELGVRVTAKDLVVTEPLRSLSARSGLIEAPAHAVDENHVLRLVSNPNRHVPLRLVLTEPDVSADSISVHNRTATIALRAQPGIRPAHVTLTAPGRRRITTTARSRNGLWHAQLVIPDGWVDATTRPSRITWAVRVEDRIGRARHVTWTDGPGRSVDVGDGLLRATATSAGDLIIEEFPRGYMLLTGLGIPDDGKLMATGVLHSAAGLGDYRLAAGDPEGLITPETVIRSDLITGEFTSAGAAVERTVVAVTGTARDADGETSSIPVLVSRSVLASLPLAAPGSSVAAERGRDRTLRLSFTPAPEGTSA